MPKSGDVNFDGWHDELDMNALADLITSDSTSWERSNQHSIAYSGGDMNGDGPVNNLDIAPFAGLPTGRTSAPEPPGLLLAVLGCAGVLALARQRRAIMETPHNPGPEATTRSRRER